MQLFKWLITEFIALVKAYWARRAKPYVRVSMLLIAGGIGILAASPVILILQLLRVVAASAGPDSPWWMDPATGFSLVVVGLLVFLWFYRSDPDRLRATPPP